MLCRNFVFVFLFLVGHAPNHQSWTGGFIERWAAWCSHGDQYTAHVVVRTQHSTTSCRIRPGDAKILILDKFKYFATNKVIDHQIFNVVYHKYYATTNILNISKIFLNISWLGKWFCISSSAFEDLLKDRFSKASDRFRNSVIKTQLSPYLCRYEDLRPVQAT